MIRKFIAAFVILVSAAAGLHTAADAYVGETRRIPNHNGASGYATLDGFGSNPSSGKWSRSTVQVNRGSNQYCVYVEAAFYTILGLDDQGWKEVRGSRTCSSTTAVHNDRSRLEYNGMKFRICQDIPRRPDTCGRAVRIRG